MRSLALLFALIAPSPLLGVGVADPSYTKHSYSCADYTPLDRNTGNIVEFRCQDGRCIEIEGKCNGVRNCEDGSDEAVALCGTEVPAAEKAAATPKPEVKEKATTTTPPPAPPAKKTDVYKVLATLKKQEAVVEQNMAVNTLKERIQKEKQEKKEDGKKVDKKGDKKEEISSEQKAVAALEKEAKSNAEEEEEATAVAEAKARKEVLAASEATIEATAPPCQTSVEGEVCYQKVVWAMTQGVKEHPEWYHGLTSESSFEAFQAALHLGHYGHCAVPCNFEMPTTATTTTTTTTLSPEALVNKTLACSTVGVYLPLDMPHTSMKTVDNVTACQERCAATEGCAKFSYYKPLRNCHLQSKYAKLVTSNTLFISGPPVCEQKDKKDANDNEMEFRKLFLNHRRSDMTGSRMSSAATLAFVAAVCGVAAAAGLVWRRNRSVQHNGELYATLQHGSRSNLQQEEEIAE